MPIINRGLETSLENMINKNQTLTECVLRTLEIRIIHMADRRYMYIVEIELSFHVLQVKTVVRLKLHTLCFLSHLCCFFSPNHKRGK